MPSWRAKVGGTIANHLVGDVYAVDRLRVSGLVNHSRSLGGWAAAAASLATPARAISLATRLGRILRACASTSFELRLRARLGRPPLRRPRWATPPPDASRRRAGRPDRRVLELPGEPRRRRTTDRLRGGPGAAGRARRDTAGSELTSWSRGHRGPPNKVEHHAPSFPGRPDSRGRWANSRS
jgi:hypothetical protein